MSAKADAIYENAICASAAPIHHVASGNTLLRAIQKKGILMKTILTLLAFLLLCAVLASCYNAVAGVPETTLPPTASDILETTGVPTVWIDETTLPAESEEATDPTDQTAEMPVETTSPPDQTTEMPVETSKTSETAEETQTPPSEHHDDSGKELISFGDYAGAIAALEKISMICTDRANIGSDLSLHADKFRYENETDRETFSTVLWSAVGMLPYGGRFGYSVGDVNGDGRDELLYMIEEEYMLIAIFTEFDGKPVLLDNFWNRYRGRIDTDGLIHTYGSNGAMYPSLIIYKISDRAPALEHVIELGCDWGSSEDRYIKLENGVKEQITFDELIELSKNPPFKNESDVRTENNPGVNFVKFDIEMPDGFWGK